MTEVLRLLTVAIATLVWLGAMVSALVGFVFFVCMFGERRPVPPVRYFLTGGIWFLIDENLSPKGLVYRRQSRQAMLIAFGFGLVFLVCGLAVHPTSVWQFLRPPASAALP